VVILGVAASEAGTQCVLVEELLRRERWKFKRDSPSPSRVGSWPTEYLSWSEYRKRKLADNNREERPCPTPSCRKTGRGEWVTIYNADLSWQWYCIVDQTLLIYNAELYKSRFPSTVRFRKIRNLWCRMFTCMWRMVLMVLGKEVVVEV